MLIYTQITCLSTDSNLVVVKVELHLSLPTKIMLKFEPPAPQTKTGSRNGVVAEVTS